ncbi:MAG: HlyD family efflux transporter periplasmic adaptor subunit [Candidatus Parcubacteria bacterium]|nr:HlyD family efflux transporter periplasmic adaptor subunit [Candidatus Parcubacteria bacterium]
MKIFSKIKSFLYKLSKWATRHKLIAGIIILAIILIAFFTIRAAGGKNNNQTKYVLAAVEKGTLIASVSGSGQVSASNQVDLKANASGDAVYVGVINGQEVKAKTLLLQLDEKVAQKSVRDAEANLESAKLSLEKLQQPADNLSILQAENSLAQAEESKRNAEDNLNKAYDDGFNEVASTFLDLPTIMTGLQSILFGNNFSGTQSNVNYYGDSVKQYDDKSLEYSSDSDSKYQVARDSYNQNFTDYKSASRTSDTAVIGSLISQTYETTRDVAETVKSANNLIQFYKDKLTERGLNPQAIADTHLSNLNTYTSKTNSHLSNLLTYKTNIENDKEAIISTDRTIAEKTESLANLKAGADALDIRTQELAIKQRENTLLDAKEKLSDYFTYAPFEGIVAEINFKKGEPVSSGAVVATLISKQKIAEISLNEVDIAKIKVGQKATLTFDAIDGLSITGEVLEVDTLGTISQGVVSYGVKIGFDTQDDRVRPGMSVSAAVITDVRQDVLMVPNSAVKSSGDISYVEILPLDKNNISQIAKSSSGVVSKNSPQQQSVQIGLSNDSFTEILNGLQEGEQVVSQTISANSTAQTQSQSSSFRMPGLGGER